MVRAELFDVVRQIEACSASASPAAASYEATPACIIFIRVALSALGMSLLVWRILRTLNLTINLDSVSAS